MHIHTYPHTCPERRQQQQLFDAFCVIFRAPPVVPELSASFSSFRVLTTVSARGLQRVCRSRREFHSQVDLQHTVLPIRFVRTSCGQQQHCVSVNLRLTTTTTRRLTQARPLLLVVVTFVARWTLAGSPGLDAAQRRRGRRLRAAWRHEQQSICAQCPCRVHPPLSSRRQTMARCQGGGERDAQRLRGQMTGSSTRVGQALCTINFVRTMVGPPCLPPGRAPLVESAGHSREVLRRLWGDIVDFSPFVLDPR